MRILTAALLASLLLCGCAGPRMHTAQRISDPFLEPGPPHYVARPAGVEPPGRASSGPPVQPHQ